MEVQQYALEMTKRAMKEFSEQEVRAMAAFVKDAFAKKFGQEWHCIVAAVLDEGNKDWKESAAYVHVKHGEFHFIVWKERVAPAYE